MSNPHPLYLLDICTSIAQVIDKKLAANLSLVCHEWYQAFTPILWRDLDLHAGVFTSSKVYTLFCNKAQYIQSLTLRGFVFTNDYPCPENLYCLQKLVLELDRGWNVSSADPIWRVKDFAPGIQENDPQLVKILRLNSNAAGGGRLKTVVLNPVRPFLGREFWRAFAEEAKSVKALVLNHPVYHSLSGTTTTTLLDPWLWKACEHLESLTLAEMWIPADLDWIPKENQVKVIKIFAYPTFLDSKKMVDCLKRFPHLRALTWWPTMAWTWIANTDHVSYAAKIENAIAVEKAWSELESLSLNGRYWSDTSLSRVLKGLKRLTRLQIPQSQISDQSMLALKTHFQTLQDLSIKDSQHLTSEMVDTILESCPALMNLTVDKLLVTLETTNGHLDKDLRLRPRRPWVCLNLRTFSTSVMILPIPGVTEASVAECHRYLFQQLGRLKALERLDFYSSFDWLRQVNQRVLGGMVVDYGVQFRLCYGLEELKGLKRLRQLDLPYTDMMGKEDLEWVRDQWGIGAMQGWLKLGIQRLEGSSG